MPSYRDTYRAIPVQTTDPPSVVWTVGRFRCCLVGFSGLRKQSTSSLLCSSGEKAEMSAKLVFPLRISQFGVSASFFTLYCLHLCPITLADSFFSLSFSPTKYLAFSSIRLKHKSFNSLALTLSCSYKYPRQCFWIRKTAFSSVTVCDFCVFFADR